MKFGKMLITALDGPDHARQRALVMKAFSRSAVELFRDYAVEVIDGLLDGIPTGVPLDFISDFSARFPVRVIQRSLGISDDRLDLSYSLAQDFITAFTVTPLTAELLERFEVATVQLNKVFNDIIAEREREPKSDLISWLVHARDGLSRLSHDEILAACLALLVAGSTSTADMLAVAVFEIVQRKDLLEMLHERPGAEKGIVSELLRFPGIIKSMVRTARENFKWHDQSITTGDTIFLINMSGNVDSEVFDNPLRIDPTRQTRDTLAFGAGAWAAFLASIR